MTVGDRVVIPNRFSEDQRGGQNDNLLCLFFGVRPVEAWHFFCKISVRYASDFLILRIFCKYLCSYVETDRRKVMRRLFAFISVCCLVFVWYDHCSAGNKIYLTTEKLVYAFPLKEDVQVMGYLREVAAGTPVDIAVSLMLPDNTVVYLTSVLEFHSTYTYVLNKFPFVAVPTTKLFPINGAMVFKLGAVNPKTGVASESTIGDMPAGRYVLKSTMSGSGVSDSSEESFWIVGADLLPSIAETPRPIIDGVNPPYADVGQEITITGRNLRGKPGLVDTSLIDNFQINVRIAGKEVPVVGMDAQGNWLRIRIPQDATSGNLVVSLTLPYWDESAGQGHLAIPRVAVWESNAFPFFLVPKITMIAPFSVMPGESVTITGLNFNSNPLANQVYFNEVPGTVTAATDTSLTVTVPMLASNDAWVQVVSNGIRGNALVISIRHPTISSYYPRKLMPGQVLTIAGVNFSDKIEENSVFLGPQSLKVISATATELQAETTAGLMPGRWPLVVQVKNAVSISGAEVVVLPGW